MNEAIKRFMHASPIVARGLIRCGFELETQETEGCTDSDGGFDEDGFNAEWDERADDFNWGDFSDAVSSNSRLRTQMAELVRAYAEPDRDDYVRPDGKAEVRGALARLNPLDRVHRSEHYLVEVGTDSSVNGFEFRTRGALKYSEFLAAARDVFKLDHTIDNGCSFHVHVSIPGVSHQYGTRFQQALVEGVLRHLHELPQALKSRWRSGEAQEFFMGLIGARQKYSFVNYNALGTWEFRCFGAIENASDGMRCLNVAIKALQFAYRVCFGSETLLSAQGGEPETLLRKCIVEFKPLTADLVRSHQNQQRLNVANY